MATSGLDSIALAVAHLEREKEPQDGKDTPKPRKSSHPTHGTATGETIQAHQATRLPPTTYSPPPNYVPFGSFPSYTPFSKQTPRMVSIDNLHHGRIGPVPTNHQSKYLESGPTSGHISPHPIRRDSMINMPYHHPLNPNLIHQQIPASPAHLHHDMHHWGPSHLHESISVSHPSPHPYRQFPHTIVPNPHDQRIIPRSSPVSSTMESPHPSSENQHQRPVASPSPPPALPSAVLAFAPTLEEFLSMELDHSAYPPVPETSEVIVQVHPNDVLLGRGGETNHHVGNIQYRQLVKICQPAYLEAKRRDKPKIAERIVHAVRMLAGRFLKKDADASTWRDVGNNRAREKTSQALREGAPELRNGLPIVPNTPDEAETKRCYDQMAKENLVTDVTLTTGTTMSSFSNSVRDHRGGSFPSNPAMSGANLYLSPFASVAVSPSDHYSESPTKKSKLLHNSAKSFEENVSNVIEPNSPSSIVAATVSGDDEESSSAPRSSDDEHSLRGLFKSEQRALPRLKLLKRRFEQNA
jgi:hypothetical protein